LVVVSFLSHSAVRLSARGRLLHAARPGTLFDACEERETDWGGRDFECRRGSARYLLSMSHVETLFLVRVERQHEE
jgi:hypothetical protein